MSASVFSTSYPKILVKYMYIYFLAKCWKQEISEPRIFPEFIYFECELLRACKAWSVPWYLHPHLLLEMLLSGADSTKIMMGTQVLLIQILHV